MKKIVFILICLACALYLEHANAANMCVRDDVMMLVLDPQIGGTALSNSSAGKTWSTSFSYGVISGIGACYSNLGTTQGGAASDQNVLSPYTTGTYCYCKMLRPAPSLWVYSGARNSTDDYCATYCAANCSLSAGSALAFRRGLFGNVGI